MPFDIPLWAWALGALLLLLAGLRALHDITQHRRRRDSEAAEALEQEQARWREGWAAFEAETDRRLTELEEDPNHPPYVISLLMGAEYPRYTVFQKRVAFRYIHEKHVRDGLIQYAPPEEVPTPELKYVRCSPQAWDSEDGAYEWLERYVDIPGRQSAYDDSPMNIGQYGVMDIEREQGSR